MAIYSCTTVQRFLFLSLLCCSFFFISCSTNPKQETVNLPQDTYGVITYPLQSLPRYYRYEMLSHLVQYLKNSSQDSLAQFSYWYQRWNREFPDEVKLGLDLVSEKLTTVRSSQLFEEKLESLMNQGVVPSFNRVTEARDLKILSMKVLETQSKKQKEPTHPTALNPVAKLAASVKPMKTPKNQDMANRFLRLSVQEMHRHDPNAIVDNAILGLADPRRAKLVMVESKKFQKTRTRTYKPFFRFKDLKGVQFLTKVHPKTDEVLDLQIFSQTSPCSSVPAEIVIEPADQKWQFKNGALRLHKKFSKVRAITGKKSRWFCLESS